MARLRQQIDKLREKTQGETDAGDELKMLLDVKCN